MIKQLRRLVLNEALSFSSFHSTRANKSTASSNLWLDRQRKDPYVKRAIKESYRARSAFKLLEMNDKYQFLKPGMTVLDIGAAPGSWCQVAVKLVNSSTIANNDEANNAKRGLVIGLDIENIEPLEGARLLPFSDITDPKTRVKVEKCLGGKQIDCILSDMVNKKFKRRIPFFTSLFNSFECTSIFRRQTPAANRGWITTRSCNCKRLHLTRSRVIWKRAAIDIFCASFGRATRSTNLRECWANILVRFASWNRHRVDPIQPKYFSSVHLLLLLLHRRRRRCRRQKNKLEFLNKIIVQTTTATNLRSRRRKFAKIFKSLFLLSSLWCWLKMKRCLGFKWFYWVLNWFVKNIVSQKKITEWFVIK